MLSDGDEKVKTLTKAFNAKATHFLAEVLNSRRGGEIFLGDVHKYVTRHTDEENVFDDFKTRECTFCDFVFKSATERNAAHRRVQLEFLREFADRMPFTMSGVSLTWYFCKHVFDVSLDTVLGIRPADLFLHLFLKLCSNDTTAKKIQVDMMLSALTAMCEIESNNVEKETLKRDICSGLWNESTDIENEQDDCDSLEENDGKAAAAVNALGVVYKYMIRNLSKRGCFGYDVVNKSRCIFSNCGDFDHAVADKSLLCDARFYVSPEYVQMATGFATRVGDFYTDKHYATVQPGLGERVSKLAVKENVLQNASSSKTTGSGYRKDQNRDDDDDDVEIDSLEYVMMCLEYDYAISKDEFANFKPAIFKSHRELEKAYGFYLALKRDNNDDEGSRPRKRQKMLPGGGKDKSTASLFVAEGELTDQEETTRRDRVKFNDRIKEQTSDLQDEMTILLRLHKLTAVHQPLLVSILVGDEACPWCTMFVSPGFKMVVYDLMIMAKNTMARLGMGLSNMPGSLMTGNDSSSIKFYYGTADEIEDKKTISSRDSNFIIHTDKRDKSAKNVITKMYTLDLENIPDKPQACHSVINRWMSGKYPFMKKWLRDFELTDTFFSTITGHCSSSLNLMCVVNCRKSLMDSDCYLSKYHSCPLPIIVRVAQCLNKEKRKRGKVQQISDKVLSLLRGHHINLASG